MRLHRKPNSSHSYDSNSLNPEDQSDNYWLNTRTPVLTYGLRGISYYIVTVSGPTRDLHSGVFGRTVHEPMTDLISLLSTLVTPDGKILIKGVDEMVPEPDEEEK
jgi:Cys-Gly metallodipeptidase DUG1